MEMKSEARMDIDAVLAAKKTANDLIHKYLNQLHELSQKLNAFYVNPIDLFKFKKDLEAHQRIVYILSLMNCHEGYYMYQDEERKAKVEKYFDRLIEFKAKFDSALSEFTGNIWKTPKNRFELNEPTFFRMDLCSFEKLAILRIINHKDYKEVKKLLKKQKLDCEYIFITNDFKICNPDEPDSKSVYEGDKCIIKITESGDRISKIYKMF